MDLHTVTDLVELRSPADRPAWRAGDAFLAGGTWLFSEPQVGLERLLDVTTLAWPALTVTPAGLELAATCTIAELAAFQAPASWPAAALIPRCCDSFVASFKVRGVATVAGNIVCALPAGPMTSLAASLGGIATIWAADGSERQVAVADLVVGAGRTSLEPGDLIRSVLLPEAALRSPAAFRRATLTTYGRTAALLVGLRTTAGMTLTITGSPVRPVVLEVPAAADSDALAASIGAAIPDSLWHSDVHGSVAWRRGQTYRLAEEIRVELLGP